MTYAIGANDFTPTTAKRFSRLSQLAEKRASRSARARERRTALAMSEEARIHAQMKYRRLRYRHMAS